MKVLMINGSPRANSNSRLCLKEMEKIFNEEGIETELVSIGNKPIRGCIACRSCSATGECVFDDEVNLTAKKLEAADGLVIASPVYYASANGTLLAFLQRLFYSYQRDLTMKVGAALVVARRSGITSSFDELNKFFSISGMAIATGQYWNGAHGSTPEQAKEDREGMQMMRTLARNMIFLLKSIELGKKEFGLPIKEKTTWTNFIRLKDQD